MKVFIGFDPRQPVAFQVCAQSVWEHASKPVEIVRLDLRTLPIQRRGLTEFTYSRFLVPWLSGYQGTSLFIDPDILVRGDICELNWDLEWIDNYDSNVAMVMHQGKQVFERASVMLFANGRCQELTPEYIEYRSCFDYAWAKNPIALPKEWNHLVSYDPPNPESKIVHMTCGIPIWKKTVGCEFSNEWKETWQRMNSSVSFEELMGRSVHIPHLEKLREVAR